MNTINTEKDRDLAELAGKISKLLDESVERMDGPISAKLLAARKKALAHFVDIPKHSVVPEWAMVGVGKLTHPFGANLRTSLVLLALLATLAGAYVWHQAMTPQGSEIAEVDEGLLTDELPINAYLDKGFDSWVKRQAR